MNFFGHLVSKKLASFLVGKFEFAHFAVEASEDQEKMLSMLKQCWK